MKEEPHFKIWPWYKRLPYVLIISACMTLFFIALLFHSSWLALVIGILLIISTKLGQDAYLEERRKYYEDRT